MFHGIVRLRSVLPILAALCLMGAEADASGTLWRLHKNYGHCDAKWDSLVQRGFELYGKDKYEEAAKLLRQALDAGCECPAVLFAYGYTQMDNADLNVPRGYLMKAQQAAGDRPGLQYVRVFCFLNLGKLAQWQGRFDDALAHYKKGSALPTWSKYALKTITEARLDLEKAMQYMDPTKLAAKWHGEICRGTPLFAACEAGHLKNYKLVKDYMGCAIEKGCDEHYVHAIYGIACLKTGVMEQAEKHLLRAEELFARGQPDHALRCNSLHALGALCEAQKRYEDALRYYGEALAKFKALRETDSYNQYLQNLPDKIALVDRLLKAENVLTEGRGKLAEQPENLAVLLAAAQGLLDAGRAVEALHYTTQSMRLAPGDPEVIVQHMRVLRELKNFRAVELHAPTGIRAAIREGNKRLAVEIFDVFSLCYHDAMKLDSGQATLARKEDAPAIGREVRRAYPNNAKAVLAQARILRRLGKFAAIRSIVPPAILRAHEQKQWRVAAELVVLYRDAVRWVGMSESAHTPENIAEVRAQKPVKLFNLGIDAAQRIPDNELIARAYKAKIEYMAGAIGGKDLGAAIQTYREYEKLPPERFSYRFGGGRISKEYWRRHIAVILAELLDGTRHAALAREIYRRYRIQPGREAALTLARDMYVHGSEAARSMALETFKRYRVAPPKDVDPEKHRLEKARRDLRLYGRIVRDMEASVRSQTTDRAKLVAFGSFQSRAVDCYISAAMELGMFSEAFETAERFQGRALRDLLGNKGFDMLNRRLARREERKLPEQESRPLGAPGTQSPGRPAGQQRGVRDLAVLQKLTEGTVASPLIDELELTSTRTVQSLTLRQVQTLLDDETSLVFVHASSWQSDLPQLGFVAVASKRGLHVTPAKGLLSQPMDLTDVCKRVRHAIAPNASGHEDAANRREMTRVLKQLYGETIALVHDKITTRRVVVVPSRDLYHVPFQLLIGPDGHYFGEKHAVSYAPSATVLSFCLAKHRQLGDRVLVLANPALQDPAYSLKFAEQEAAEIRKLYPKADCLLGAAATESAVRSTLRQSDIVHFACHNVFNKKDPMTSFLALAPDEKHDGRLTATEILGLHSPAQMVVLSACETGGGKVSLASHELLGMLRAWMFAGAPSVVVSLWKLDDRATSELMAEFYKNLRSMSRAEALQQAQLAMMNKYENPYYWGAFVLYGDYR